MSDAVRGGALPEALTVLNADAAWSVQLECDRDEAGNAAALGLTYYCTMSRSLVRVGRGDVVAADTVSWPDVFGANVAQALTGGNVKQRAPKLLADDVAAFTATWGPAAGPWTVDLRVAGLADRAAADALLARLGAVPGVEEAAIVVFNKGLSQFSLAGSGADALGSVAERLEAGAGLRVTHDADGLIRAVADLGRAVRRPYRAFVAPPAAGPKDEAAAVAARAEPIVRGALANVSWVSLGEVTVGPPGASRPPSALLKSAKAAGEPHALMVAFARQGDRHRVDLSVHASGDGASRLAVSEVADDPLSALDRAARALDARIADATARASLGLEGSASAPEPVQVVSFELEPLFPWLARRYAEEGAGSLTLKHAGSSPLGDLRLALSVDGWVVAEAPLEPLAPGEERVVPVRWPTLPALDPQTTATVQATATLSYTVGGLYGRARAYAPLLVHRATTIDWSEPRAVAAFIDPTAPAVRALATSALNAPLPAGLPPRLARAAFVHDAVWQAPLRYVADPVQTSFDASLDDVSPPGHTLATAAGDCDDLTVLLASLWESVGLSTAIVTTPGHVLVAVDTGLLAGGHVLTDRPADDFVIIDGALFAPIEATAVGQGFASAWSRGADVVRAAGAQAVAFRTREAWRSAPTASWPAAGSPALPGRPVDPARATAGLPALRLPDALAGAHPIAAPVVAWLNGRTEEGVTAAAEDCARGVSESCFNLAVMLIAAEGSSGEPFPEPVLDALVLMPPAVVTMLIDHGGLGVGDEASEGAVLRRRLSAALEQARARVGAPTARLDPASIGRRSAQVGAPAEVAPWFFFAPVEAR